MASIGIAYNLRLHNQIDRSSFWNDFKVRSSNTWHRFSLNFNPKSPIHVTRRPYCYNNHKKPLSEISEAHNYWAFIHASATPPLTLFTALALVLESIKGRLIVGREQGRYIIKTTVKKWLTRLQGCSNVWRNAERGNDRFLQQGGIGMALLSTTLMAKEHISPVLETLGANPTFMSGLLAWLIAQILKVVTTFVVERRWDLKMLVGSGGMPSSHSALCIGLTTSVALCHGVNDSLFPVCLGFSLIVMYDATGVRRHAGKQAEDRHALHISLLLNMSSIRGILPSRPNLTGACVECCAIKFDGRVDRKALSAATGVCDKMQPLFNADCYPTTNKFQSCNLQPIGFLAWSVSYLPKDKIKEWMKLALMPKGVIVIVSSCNLQFQIVQAMQEIDAEKKHVEIAIDGYLVAVSFHWYFSS
eukprot:Gb_24007 [translate_table: standard]